MGAKKKFPMSVKAGSTAIKIYKSPLTNKAWKKYDSYLVCYHRGGDRIRSRQKTLTAAKDEAHRIATKIKNEDLEALKLTGADRLAYIQASKIAQDSGLSLDLMAKQYASAKVKLGDVELMKAIRFYTQHGAKVDDVGRGLRGRTYALRVLALM
jgi:hypothetical protein